MRSLHTYEVFCWRRVGLAVMSILLLAGGSAALAEESEPVAVILEVTAAGTATEVQWMQLPNADMPAGAQLVVRTLEGQQVAQAPIAANPGSEVMQGPFVAPVAAAFPEQSMGGNSLQQQVAIEDAGGGPLSPAYVYALLPLTLANGCGFKVIGGAELGGAILISDELEELLDNLTYDDLDDALQALLPEHPLACEIEALLAALAELDEPIGLQLGAQALDLAHTTNPLDDCFFFWHARVRRSPSFTSFRGQWPLMPTNSPGFVELVSIETGGFQCVDVQAVGVPGSRDEIFSLPASWTVDGRVELDLALRRRRGPGTCSCTADAVFSTRHVATVFISAARREEGGEAGAVAIHRASFSVDNQVVLDAKVEVGGITAGRPLHESHDTIEETRSARFAASSFAARLDLHGESNAAAEGTAWSYAYFINPYYRIAAEATASCAQPQLVRPKVTSDNLITPDATKLRRWPRLQGG